MQEQETIHAVMAPLDDDSIKSRILTIRGVQVILDRDIAFLYGVETKVLNQAVKRNRECFSDVLIATTHKSATKFISPTAVAKFNKQNPTLTIKTVGSFHDRFLILDGTELYHLNAPKKREPRFEGEIRRRRTRRALKRPRASMKDLGRQYCAITKMDAMFIPSIMQRIP